MPPKTKARRRKYRRYMRGKIQISNDLGTLAPKVLVGFIAAESVTETTWLSSIVASWNIVDLTPQAGNGPIAVGIAHSDYADSEIEAWIENAGGWDQGNLVSKEIGQRKIRQVGVINTPGGGVSATLSAGLNDGRLVKTKCNWLLSTGDALKFWAYNMGDTALATTDPDLNIIGHANLWPR